MDSFVEGREDDASTKIPVSTALKIYVLPFSEQYRLVR